MSDQWVHFFSIPHSFELIYFTGASDKHHLSDASVDASNRTEFHLRTLLSGYASVPAALKEAHMRQNVSMWERRGQSQYRPHTPFSAQQPKRTPLLPYLRRCQGLVPCQRQAHFHRQSQEAFWQGRPALLFLDRAFSAQTFCVQSWETWQGDNRRLQGSWRVISSAYGASATERKDLPPR